jgi:hypothetical protein
MKRPRGGSLCDAAARRVRAELKGEESGRCQVAAEPLPPATGTPEDCPAMIAAMCAGAATLRYQAPGLGSIVVLALVLLASVLAARLLMRSCSTTRRDQGVGSFAAVGCDAHALA